MAVPPEEENWEQLIELDKKYFLRPIATSEEYSPFPIARAEGAYLVTPEGIKILDFMSTLHCANLGPYHPKITKVMKKYLDYFGYLYEGGFVASLRPKVVKLLMEEAFQGDMAKVGFVSTGSEAVEYALLIAKIYKQKPYILTRDFAYHGWTHAAIGGTRVPYLRNIAIKPALKRRQAPEIIIPPGTGMFFQLAPPPYCYRCPIGHEYPDCKDRTGILACVSRTKDIIETLQPEIAAIIMEVVFGSCGVFAPPPEYIPQMRKVTKDTGILWIDDEVICGFGRTGKWFGYQHYDVKPDIVDFAKGITGAHFPVGGVAINEEIAKWFDDKRWWHASTYACHPVGMAAAYGALTTYKEGKLMEHAEKMGKYLEEKLMGLEERHKSVGHVSGMGLIWGIDFVKNKETKETFVPEDKRKFWYDDYMKYPCKIIGAKCFERRLLVSTFAANNVTLMPPVIVTEKDIDLAIDILDDAIKEIDKKAK